MRGTLISRKTMAPKIAIKIGTRYAALPKSASAARAVAAPSAPEWSGAASAIPSKTAMPKAAIPAISRFNRIDARALRRPRAIAGTLSSGRPHTCTRRTLRLVATPPIVVLEGDETGQELLVEALRVLDPAVIGMQLAFERFDLSLERR